MTLPEDDELYLRICYPDVDTSLYVEDNSCGSEVNGRYYWIKGGWNLDLVGSATYFRVFFRPPDLHHKTIFTDRSRMKSILLRGRKNATFPRWYINNVRYVDLERKIGYDKHGLLLPNDNIDVHRYIIKKMVHVCKKLIISKLSSVTRFLQSTQQL